MKPHSLEFLREIPKAFARELLKDVKPEQIAQQMEIATACAYALKDERIAKAKEECAARRKRKEELARKNSLTKSIPVT